MTDLTHLRTLAEKATPGPWLAPPGWTWVLAEGLGCVVDHASEEDAHYIGAVSPDVLLSLLDRLERAEERQCVADSCDEAVEYAGAYRLGGRKIILGFCELHFDETADDALTPERVAPSEGAETPTLTPPEGL